MIGRLIRQLIEKRRSTMALKSGRNLDGSPDGTKSQNVVFQLTNDGLEPKVAPWGFIGRNPVQLVLGPKESRRIDLLVAADVPLLVWPTRSHTDDTKVEGPMIVPPGTNVSCIVTNISAHGGMSIEDGEALLCLHPLFFAGTSTVG